MKTKPRLRPGPYTLVLLTLIIFVIFAFIASTPWEILTGLGRIFTSRSLLSTDYIAVGGLGAALVNATLTGLFYIGLMRLVGVKANGALFMAIWLAIGFSFFGKNILNILPIIFGVWLYSRFQKEPFANYTLVAILSSTLAPVVSEFAFSDFLPHFALNLLLGIIAGTFVGFFIPVISSATNRVHSGYNLYNIGFAGGIIAFFLAAFGESMGIFIEAPNIVSHGNNLLLAIMLYIIFAFWAVCSLLLDDKSKRKRYYKELLAHSGRLVTDYYLLFKESAYMNMAVLGALGTTVILVLGASLNGLTLAGIFTMMGFATFGKHIRNCVPVMAGSFIFSCINSAPPADITNALPILFCTGLAPISGQYGWYWGVVAGIMHNAIVGHVGKMANGLNLYNNGLAAGFVALVLVPIILAFKRRKKHNEASV